MRVARLAVVVASAISMVAQTSESRKITVEVVAQDGAPIRDAEFFNVDEGMLPAHYTDSSGRVQFETSGPAFVVRKPGYESRLVRLGSETDLRLVLREAAVRPPLPSCRTRPGCVTIRGWRRQFCFLLPKGMKARLRQADDVDYGLRIYFVKGRREQAYIAHGAGAQWSMGFPLETDVWPSVQFRETSYSIQGRDTSDSLMLVRDARGISEDGKHWRFLGMFGETASYDGVTEEEARLLDQALDSVCLLDP